MSTVCVQPGAFGSFQYGKGRVKTKSNSQIRNINLKS